MIFRSQCSCECHKNPQILHIEPCCYPDPSLELGWKELEKRLIEKGMKDKELIVFAKFHYYMGASTLIVYLEAIRQIGIEAGAEIWAKINMEIRDFMEQFSDKKG